MNFEFILNGTLYRHRTVVGTVVDEGHPGQLTACTLEVEQQPEQPMEPEEE